MISTFVFLFSFFADRGVSSPLGLNGSELHQGHALISRASKGSIKGCAFLHFSKKLFDNIFTGLRPEKPAKSRLFGSQPFLFLYPFRRLAFVTPA
jgi:hypothetical protein